MDKAHIEHNQQDKQTWTNKTLNKEEYIKLYMHSLLLEDAIHRENA